MNDALSDSCFNFIQVLYFLVKYLSPKSLSWQTWSPSCALFPNMSIKIHKRVTRNTLHLFFLPCVAWWIVARHLLFESYLKKEDTFCWSEVLLDFSKLRALILLLMLEWHVLIATLKVRICWGFLPFEFQVRFSFVKTWYFPLNPWISFIFLNSF